MKGQSEGVEEVEKQVMDEQNVNNTKKETAKGINN